jgi:hypothetical protein
LRGPRRCSLVSVSKSRTEAWLTSVTSVRWIASWMNSGGEHLCGHGG